MMDANSLERYKQDRNDFHLAYLKMLEQSPTPELRLIVTSVKASLDRYDRIISCAEEGKPFIASLYSNAPEIFVAMNLSWHTLIGSPFTPAASLHLPDDIDAAENMGLGTDMCTIIRLSIYYIEAGLVPLPTAFVGLLSPCDGATILHQAIAHNKEWRNVPMFCNTPPYWEDERGIDSCAGELRQMATFLEEHTGHRLDIGRLKEVIEESNKQYELWAEYNELRRAVPCPYGQGWGIQAFNVAQNTLVGDSRGTDWFRELVELTERRVQEKKGSVQDERIRLFWFDMRPVWFPEVAGWLKKEWGACIVMDMSGYTPYTLIDTSSEDSMFRGLAKRSMCDMPMIRQARGLADNFVYDITKIVKDYGINCVVWPGHMGHKDGNGSIGIMRDLCRDLGVPFLNLGLDSFDQRYTTVDELKGKITQFFTAMNLG